MTDQQFGSLIRAVRLKQRLRQSDVAVRAGVSQATVSRIERGHLGRLSVETVRMVAAALDIRADFIGRWRSGDLDRLMSARHSALSESVVRAFPGTGWLIAPEVSFSIYGERGIIDLLAWNPARRALLVIELKTEIVDVNELVGTFDRKIRLGARIAREHGWAVEPETAVSAWVIVTDSRTNRRRLEAHAAMLRAAFPIDGRAIRPWLRKPIGSIRCLSFWSPARRPGGEAVKRVSSRRTASMNR